MPGPHECHARPHTDSHHSHYPRYTHIYYFLLPLCSLVPGKWLLAHIASLARVLYNVGSQSPDPVGVRFRSQSDFRSESRAHPHHNPTMSQPQHYHPSTTPPLCSVTHSLPFSRTLPVTPRPVAHHPCHPDTSQPAATSPPTYNHAATHLQPRRDPPIAMPTTPPPTHHTPTTPPPTTTTRHPPRVTHCASPAARRPPPVARPL
jgi:hypothetical protein